MSILSCRHLNLDLQTFTRLYSFVSAIYAHAGGKAGATSSAGFRYR